MVSHAPLTTQDSGGRGERKEEFLVPNSKRLRWRHSQQMTRLGKMGKKERS